MENRDPESDEEEKAMSKRGAREGSIYKRGDGRWVAAVSIGAGKRKTVYGETRRDVAETLKTLPPDATEGPRARVVGSPHRRDVPRYVDRRRARVGARLNVPAI
jgi:hypothetical protein